MYVRKAGSKMKEGIHPATYPVVFVDGDHEWVGVSTHRTNNTKVIDGIECSVIPVDISAFSHPFYTGQKKLVDTAGRVEKFMRRYGQQMANQGKK
ncbi:MAG: 50S ribosomal protein L31 [Fimbriimonas sp.]|nr:50S ribosomal protein L31 [Fimbriimonas sp.]